MLLSSRFLFFFASLERFVYYTARPFSARHVRILYRLAFSVRILYRLVYYTFPQGTFVYYTENFSARKVWYIIPLVYYTKCFRKVQYIILSCIIYRFLRKKKAGISPRLNHDNRITCKSFINKTAMLKKLDT